jgi:hypothetical protein
VNPAYIGRVQGDDSSGKIYRGRHLAAGALAGSRSKKLDASSVPWDDPRAMRRLRDSTKRAEQTGRMVRARVGALDYRLGLRRDAQGRAIADGEAQQEHLLPDEDFEEPRDNRSEKEKQEELVYAGGGTGYSSLANERIQEAMRSGAFRNNSLRGSKLQTLDEESNPYLSREERLMNRLVKRQGAAPPFVELNSELEAAHTGFRAKLIDAWVRRASRMLLADTSLNHLSAPGIDDVALEAALQELARTHRDVEWERAERAFHEVSVKEVNNAVRKYNGIAPFHARRALITVEAELQRALTNAAPALVQALREGLQLRGGRAAPSGAAAGHGATRTDRSAWQLWGGADQSSSIVDGQGVSSRAREAGSRSASDFEQELTRGARRAPGPGLLVMLRRTVERAKALWS